MKHIPDICARMELLKDWQEVSLIGEGGNGAVFHVRHAADNSDAALKWIHLEYDNGLSRNAIFSVQKQQLEEIFNMQNLSRVEQIVQMKGYEIHNSEDGLCMDIFILQELLTPLRRKLRDGRFTVGDSARMAADVAAALKACHAQNIIHGDVKPDNILCSEERFKLADFGVSLRQQRNNLLTPGGTHYFQPPEYRTTNVADASCDTYALGMTLYLLFNNGMLPFQKELTEKNEDEAWAQCCALADQPGAQYPAPKAAPEAVAEVLVKATAQEAAARYQSPGELAEAFCRAVSGLSPEQQQKALTYAEDPIYRSTRALTPNFSKTKHTSPQADEEGDEPQEPATTGSGATVSAPEASPFSMQSGFEPVPVVPLSLQTDQTDVPEKPKQRPKWLVPVIAAAGAAVILLVVVLALVLKQPPLTVTSVETERFSAVLRLENAVEGTAHVCVTGAAAGYEVPLKGDVLTLTNLAPETSYVVTVNAGGQSVESTFRTLAPAEGRFQPLMQHLRICPAELPEQLGLQDLRNSRELLYVDDLQLKLEQTRLGPQNLAILLSCDVKCEPGDFEADNLYLVLRTPDDVIVQAIPQGAGTLPTYGSFNVIPEFSSLFDQYFSRHGRHFKGVVQLEVYWLDELIGSVELTLQ